MAVRRRLPTDRRCVAGHQPQTVDACLDRQPAQHCRLCDPQFPNATGRPVTDGQMRNDIVIHAAIRQVSRKGCRHLLRQRPERLIGPRREPDLMVALFERRVFGQAGDRAGYRAEPFVQLAENMRENRVTNTFAQVKGRLADIGKAVGLAYVGSYPTPAISKIPGQS